MLTERQKIILEFCRGGKNSREIAQRIKMAHASVYPELRALQSLGLLEKTGSETRASRFRQPSIFITIGDDAQIEAQDQPEHDPELVNVAFIKHSHNIWRVAA